jgi:hypothetical protein
MRVIANYPDNKLVRDILELRILSITFGDTKFPDNKSVRKIWLQNNKMIKAM